MAAERLEKIKSSVMESVEKALCKSLREQLAQEKVNEPSFGADRFVLRQTD